MSQESLAHELDMARSYISGLERGRHNPSFDIGIRIAQILGISFADFAALVERYYKKRSR